MKRVFLAMAAVLCVCGIASGEIPLVIGYQGRITENTGVPVANGTYPMQFQIFDAETGGTLLWNSGTLSVDTNAGVFSVSLGEAPQDSIDLPFDQDYWLLVTYRGEDQLPRKRLASTGYAYMASGLVAGTEVSGSVTTGTSAAIKGTNTAATDTTYGLYGASSSTDGYGIYGDNTSGWAGGFGGRVHITDNVGIGTTDPGVSRLNVQTGAVLADGEDHFHLETIAGWSDNDGDVLAVVSARGDAATETNILRLDNAVGTKMVVRGDGDVGIGTAAPAYKLHVDAGSESAVYGTTSSTTGVGVYGEATATTGINYGVCGTTYSGGYDWDWVQACGVLGRACATASINGYSAGVMGENLNQAGIGVYGYSDQYAGVLGWSESTTAPGVKGSGDFCGVGGSSGPGMGIYGLATGYSGTNYGVYGVSYSTDGYGGFFVGRSFFSGNVGIGTNDPMNRLDVEGGVAVGGPYAGTSTAPLNGMIVQGNVGIGTATPSGKLHVAGGDFVVTGSGAYRGDIGPNNGAPFPRPAYDSGWMALGAGQDTLLYHNLGAPSDNYVVDMQFRDGGMGANPRSIQGLGGDLESGGDFGAYWGGLTASEIRVVKGANHAPDSTRVRIWVYN